MFTKTVIFSSSISCPAPTFGAPRGGPAIISTSMRLSPGMTRVSYTGHVGSEPSAFAGEGFRRVLPRVTKSLV